MTKLTSSNARQIINALEGDKSSHESWGFKITYFHWYHELNIQYLRYSLGPLAVHIYSKYEHVVFIYKAISTVKERTWSIFHDVPRKTYIGLMTHSLVEVVVGLLKYFPSKNCVSETMSSSMKVEVKVIIYMGLKGYICHLFYALFWYDTYHENK